VIAILNEEQIRHAETEEIRCAIGAAHLAQNAWATRPAAERARAIARIRPLLAAEATELARLAAAVHERPIAEKIVSEVLPLLDACKFLARVAQRVLRTKRFGAAGRPFWLYGSSFEVQRKPLGIVLIVSAGNYPLFLPGVQMLQALAAGNAVLLKPAEGTSAVVARFAALIAGAGVPADLVQILPESPQTAHEAARLGVDKVIFTGSSENGRDFLARLARSNTPSVMELSGADTVYVRADADLALAASAIRFGSHLNGGDTCMAPQSVVVHREVAARFAEALQREKISLRAIVRVRDDSEALEIAAMDDHGLGAAIFSRDEISAREFAQHLTTGFVTINDIIVPTADPRLPFGGVRASGFGVTRGEEGLLEMTYPQAIATRRTRFLPHLQAPSAYDAGFFAAFVELVHGRGFSRRFRALRALLRIGRARMRSSQQAS